MPTFLEVSAMARLKPCLFFLVFGDLGCHVGRWLYWNRKSWIPPKKNGRFQSLCRYLRFWIYCPVEMDVQNLILFACDLHPFFGSFVSFGSPITTQNPIRSEGWFGGDEFLTSTTKYHHRNTSGKYSTPRVTLLGTKDPAKVIAYTWVFFHSFSCFP